MTALWKKNKAAYCMARKWVGMKKWLCLFTLEQQFRFPIPFSKPQSTGSFIWSEAAMENADLWALCWEAGLLSALPSPFPLPDVMQYLKQLDDFWGACSDSEFSARRQMKRWILLLKTIDSVFLHVIKWNKTRASSLHKLPQNKTDAVCAVAQPRFLPVGIPSTWITERLAGEKGKFNFRWTPSSESHTWGTTGPPTSPTTSHTCKI